MRRLLSIQSALLRKKLLYLFGKDTPNMEET